MYNVNKRHSILFYATLLVLDDSGSGKWCASNQTLAKKKKKVTAATGGVHYQVRRKHYLPAPCKMNHHISTQYSISRPPHPPGATT